MIYSLKISTSNLSDFLLIQRLLVSFGVVSIKVVSLPKTIKRFVFIKYKARQQTIIIFW